MVRQDTVATELDDDGEISIIDVLTTIVRNWWKIVAWAVAAAVFAVWSVWDKPPVYMSTATFSTGGGGSQQSALAGLAGQLGLLTSSGGGGSPDFYVMLMKSPVLLSRVVDDTFTVAEMGGRRMKIHDVLGVTGRDSVERDLRAMNSVRGMVDIEKQTGTGLLVVSARTPWPSVSLALASSYVNALEEYNRDSRRTQAAVERRFVEGLLKDALAELREAEDNLQRFVDANREISPWSGLGVQRERLNRVVQLKNQVYITLATGYEDARIREVRDTPIINVVEPPRVKLEPEPRKLGRRALIGAVIGVILGIVLTLASETARRIARHRPDETAELSNAVREATSGLRRVLRLGR